MSENNKIEAFDEYIRQGEPQKREKAYLWRTAIGLQKVDGLTTSNFLLEKAQENIEGDITIEEVRQQIDTYYRAKQLRVPDDVEKEEADKVSSNIAAVLSSRTFAFNTNGFISLHRRIFDGVFKHAGEIRQYDITKKEWVLDGDTVNYLNWEDLRRAMDYDIEQERAFSYKGLAQDQIISHITCFVSGIWQIHPFGEGNTRTTAVFTIQYLRSMGFNVDNDLFASCSWYFRNALVRANYKNIKLGIDYTPAYLERFFSNLLFGDKWVLKNRYLHINRSGEWKEQPNLKDQEAPVAPTSTRQVPDKLQASSINILQLVKMIGKKQLKVKEMLQLMNLRNRENFMALYLSPAISQGYVCMLYPESPRHPKQRYQLTVKGLALYSQ